MGQAVPGGPPVRSAALARALVTALVAHGLRDVVYCPGSRDAPFAYALDAAQHAGWLRVAVRLDERAAGFQALGLAKAAAAQGTARPVAVVTTSGTAVANLHPAVLEADAAGVALVVVSADRPHEMWRTGANQTTEQLGIFAHAVRQEADIPAGFPVDGRLSGLVRRAMTAALGNLNGNSGPVHLNVCLREPLKPDDQWLPGPAPAPEPHREAPGAPTELPMPDRTVVVAGDGAGDQAQQAATAGGWPLLAEPSSGARFGANALTDYQQLLGSPLAPPDRGRAGVRASHLVTSGLGAVGPRRRADGGGHLRFPVDRCGRPCPGGARPGAHRQQPAGGVAGTVDRGRRAGAAQHQGHGGTTDLAGPWRARRPGPGAGGLGSDPLLRPPGRPGGPCPLVIANRGLAGIDGTVSTAIGVAAGTGRPVRAVVGDLTLAHDGLGLLRGMNEAVPDVQVVVLADRGGAIFAGLEHGSAAPALLSRYFLTPQVLDVRQLAGAVGASYRHVTDVLELPQVLSEPISGASIVEVELPPVG